jgi:hypothetical protein
MKPLYILMFMIAGAPAVWAADLITKDAVPAATPAVLENCAFVTNNCETCVVDAAGQPSCSSVGIGCVVTEKSCLIKKKAE